MTQKARIRSAKDKRLSAKQELKISRFRIQRLKTLHSARAFKRTKILRHNSTSQIGQSQSSTKGIRSKITSMCTRIFKTLLTSTGRWGQAISRPRRVGDTTRPISFRREALSSWIGEKCLFSLKLDRWGPWPTSRTIGLAWDMGFKWSRGWAETKVLPWMPTSPQISITWTFTIVLGSIKDQCFIEIRRINTLNLTFSTSNESWMTWRSSSTE